MPAWVCVPRWDKVSWTMRCLCGAGNGKDAGRGTTAEWVKRAARATSRSALHSVAVSSDGALLAVGGGDRKVHVFDARTGGYVQAFPGHR